MRLFFIFLCSLSIQLSYAQFHIGKIANSNSPLPPLKIQHYRDLYYPSRVFDLVRVEGKYRIYNIHIVYLDSTSTPKLRTVQVKIPKKFKETDCFVNPNSIRYTFKNKSRRIIVTAPAIEQDSLAKYSHSVLYTYPFDFSKYQWINEYTGNYDENRYIGGIQSGSLHVFFCNFKRKQKEEFEDTLQKLFNIGE